jgi:hypothetical protein
MLLLILYGVVLPAAVAALMVAPLPRIPAIVDRPRGAVAVAGGFVAAFFALGFQELRSNEGWPWLALAAAVIGAMSVPWIPRVVLWIGLAAFVARQVIPAGLFEDEDWQPLRIHCYAAVVGGVAALGLIATTARRIGVLVWALLVGGGAGVLFWSGNGLFAQMAVALAAALAAVGLIGRGRLVASGATAVAAGLHPALLAAGCFNNFSDVPTWAFAVVGLAPIIVVPFRRVRILQGDRSA